jgi:predicted benzoate:H+ symporter BenE
MTQLAPVIDRPHDRNAAEDGRLRFDLRELSGSLGDLGTFLPLAVAMALVCGMDIAAIFIFAGVMNVATGWLFRQPIPVQPMKAIAAVAIAEGLSAGQIAGAGLITGAAVLTLALSGGVDWIVRSIPKPVVRGIQAGVGVKLAIKGAAALGATPMIGLDSWMTAIIVATAVLLLVQRRVPVLLLVFLAGLAMTMIGGAGGSTFALQAPRLELITPTAHEWWTGLTRGAAAQLPLTLLNSVVAVCALSGDYFPGRGISPKRMAVSVGVMNLLCVPWGAMPMCHGAGGLAAQHRFGARTGGSVVMLGAMKIAAGLMLGSILLDALRHYPASILAVMLIAAGLTLASAARDSLKQPRAMSVTLITAIAIVCVNTLAGFILGAACAALLTLIRSRTPQAKSS